MNEELPKVYDPSTVEKKWYKFWEENDFFKPDPQAQEAFTVVIPPPNITGSLHMGHALNNTIQDVLIRYKRMCGFKTLWVPGTDHAGIATQNVVERDLKKEGKRKEDLGREKFLERVWEWKKVYGGQITQQLRRLGASCDWSRERFTMDEGLSRAVKRHFIQLYQEGLIYRGKRIINWCPRCKTALSDIEVEHETVKGSLWHIKYQVTSNQKSETSKYLTVATTRPETMLGDTAVAVNPKDERYHHLWGKTVELPLVGRRIPIVKDDYVDPAFGTGAVKVTPAHDPNDYEIAMRHNLPFLNIFTPEARITFAEFEEKEKEKVKELEGLDRFTAREKLLAMLKEQGYLVKVEDYETSVGHCYRCKTVIEPYLSDQWFVKVKPLAEKAIAAVEEGKIKFVPERWTKVYLQWMTNLKDWCISRQLWWGHQIPAYYCKSQITNSKPCGEIIVSEKKPDECPKCGGTDLEQDPDVFDTWFSSALWPFSVLGWPEETEDLKTYYPTDVLVTGYDIITFWVSRMIMAGLHFMKEIPFHTVYVHGLVRDITGKKMSKSLGNVIDPLEVINRVGADALRFALISLITGQGQDIKLSEEKIVEARNFANKIWNASRFVLMNVNNLEVNFKVPENLDVAGRWIISRLNRTIQDVTASIEAYEFGQAARQLYEFIWSEFCDWYIEISKIDLYSSDHEKKERVLKVLFYVLENTLRLLHPFMPFITEEIWQKLKERVETKEIEKIRSVSLSRWPIPDDKLIALSVLQDFEYLKAIVISIRGVRANYGLQTKEVEVYLIPGNEDEKRIIKESEHYIKFLARASKVVVSDSEKPPKQSAAIGAFSTRGFVPLKGLIDIEKEIERFKREELKITTELDQICRLMADENFVSKASPEAIEKQKLRRKELEEKKKNISERLRELA